MQKGKESKPHIGIFGRRNNGKSSFINKLAGQHIAIVSDHAGTTTDPVKKSFEITGFGPVILIDTAGIDDTGELGEKRVSKTRSSIKTIDLGILLITHNTFSDFEEQVIKEFKKNHTPYLIIHNKSDLEPLDSGLQKQLQNNCSCDVIDFSLTKEDNTENIIQLIKKNIPESAYKTPSLVGDLLEYGDIVLLITPIDIEAPAGRLILPQVQAIRDVLDNDAVSIVLKEREVDGFLKKTGIKPKLAITDSQMFTRADSSIPDDVPLTSFSIVLARYKGDFENYLNGTPHISNLKDGDRVLLLESCTHHVSCDDIGRVKIPRWISDFTGKNIEYEVVAGLNDLPGDIHEYALVVQCGGCMITRKQLINRIRPAVEAGIPVTNYGMTIAYVQGIYHRAIAPFVDREVEALDYL
jgi:[FeFe] hydrogenase H-cluster maturation GTPase HydF